MTALLTTHLHRITCALMLVLAAGTLVVLLSLHDGTASEQATWLGGLIAVTAAANSARGRCGLHTSPEAAARR